MKNCKYIFTLLLFGITIGGPVSDVAAENETSDPHSVMDNGFLFSIEKNDKKSFLLGTLHGGISSSQALNSYVKHIALNAAKIYVEADIRDKEETRRILNEVGFDADGSTLERKIGQEYYISFKSAFVDRVSYFTEEQFSRMRPWFLMFLLPTSLSKNSVQINADYGTEAQLFSLLEGMMPPIGELEGVRGMAEILARMDAATEKSYFEAYLEKISDGTVMRRNLDEIDAWTSGSLEKLEAITSEIAGAPDDYSKNYYRLMLVARNLTMEKKIATISEINENILFTIGSEHLTGPMGVLEKLRQDGYIIKRIQQ